MCFNFKSHLSPQIFWESPSCFKQGGLSRFFSTPRGVRSGSSACRPGRPVCKAITVKSAAGVGASAAYNACRDDGVDPVGAIASPRPLSGPAAKAGHGLILDTRPSQWLQDNNPPRKFLPYGALWGKEGDFRQQMAGSQEGPLFSPPFPADWPRARLAAARGFYTERGAAW